MENGAVATSYYSSGTYTSDNYKHYYNNAYNYSDHAVTIVGWDDTISKTLFKTQPAGDGAWLIKNSWGTYYGYSGYMWISYYDTSILNSEATVYTVVPADTYNNCYQYDGASYFSGSYSMYKKYANTFMTDALSEQTQILNAVSFSVMTVNTSYSIQIYINSTAGQPESGTPALAAPIVGTTDYEGYYTIKLPTTVTLKAGDTFSVVVSFDDYAGMMQSRGTSYEMMKNSLYVGSTLYNYSLTGHNTSSDYQSMHYNYSGWVNDSTPATGFNYCIKAFTTDYNSTDIAKTEIIQINQSTVNDATIAWQKASGATGYELYKSTQAAGPFAKIYDGAEVSYKDTSVAYGNTYYYRVISYEDTSGSKKYASGYSQVSTIKIDIPVPSISVSGGDALGITINITNEVGADGYYIYRSISTNDMDFTKIGTITSGNNSYVDTTAEHSTRYYYYVVAYKTISGQIKESQNSDKAYTELRKSAPILKLDNDNAQGTVKLSWSKVEGVDGYVILRQLPGETSYTETVVLNNADILEYTDDGDYEIGSYVRYSVCGYNDESSGVHLGSKSYEQCAIRTAALSNLSAELSGKNLLIKWDSYVPANTSTTINTAEASYKVYIYKNGSTSPEIYNKYPLVGATSVTFIYSTYKPTDTYKIVVYAYASTYSTVNQSTSGKELMTATQAMPAIVEATLYPPKNISGGYLAQTGILDLTWDAVEMADQYFVYRCETQNGTYKNIGAVTSNSISDTNVVLGQTYYYKIISYSSQYGISTAYSAPVAVTCTDNRIELTKTNTTVSTIAKQTYLGVSIMPEPTISYNGNVLNRNTDYALSYKNNKNAGMATVTVSGRGAYKGSYDISFEIEKMDISKVTFSKTMVVYFAGYPIYECPTMRYNGMTLLENTDFTVTYTNNTGKGIGYANITGTGNFTGTVTRIINIK